MHCAHFHNTSGMRSRSMCALQTACNVFMNKDTTLFAMFGLRHGSHSKDKEEVEQDTRLHAVLGARTFLHKRVAEPDRKPLGNPRKTKKPMTPTETQEPWADLSTSCSRCLCSYILVTTSTDALESPPRARAGFANNFDWW